MNDPVFPLYSKKTYVGLFVYFMLGISQLINGFFAFESGDLLFSALYMVIFIACIYVIWSSIGPVNKHTPRIEIKKNHIFVKEDVFFANQVIFWDKIKHIKLSNLALTITLEDRSKKYFYFKFDIPKLAELKQTIQHHAEQFEITIELT